MNTSAENYASSNDTQIDYGTKIIDRYVYDVKPTDAILDIGSGTGEITSYMHDVTGCHVIGLDIMDDMTEYASQKYGHTKIKFITGDMQDSEWINRYQHHKKFKWVMALNSIHWVDDVISVLHNIWEVLESGGRVLIYYFLRHHKHNEFYFRINEVLNRSHWKKQLDETDYKVPALMRDIKEDEKWRTDDIYLINKMKKIGFSIESSDHMPVVYYIVTEAYFKSLISAIKYIKLDQQQRLLQELMESCCDRYDTEYSCLIAQKS